MNKKIIKFVSVFLILCLINPLPAFAANDELDSKNNSALSSTAQSLLPATSAMLPAISKDLYEQYVLGPGDSLTVNIIVGRNSLNQRFDITLSFDGKAFFPSIGAMDLNGIKLKDAEKVIGKQLSRYFKEAFVINVKLSGVKSINVYATGNVLRPGGSTVAYGTRLSQFIAAAGIAGGGSARTVFVSRRGSKHSFDMMAPMLNGDFKQDIFLEPDDIVEIPIVENNRVTIMGGISRPGMYEMKKGEKLSDLLKIAGYSTVNSALSSAVLLKRVFDKENFVQYNVNVYDLLYKNDQTQNIELIDGDIVTIPSIDMFVYVYGEVPRTGKIAFLPGKKLSDYINLAGGPTARANLAGTYVTRNVDGKAQVFRINAEEILYKGIQKYDMELRFGDIVSVPANFFYFTDFASFANTVMVAITLYSAISSFTKK